MFPQVGKSEDAAGRNKVSSQDGLPKRALQRDRSVSPGPSWGKGGPFQAQRDQGCTEDLPTQVWLPAFPAHPGSEYSGNFQATPRWTELATGLWLGIRLSSWLLLL